MNASPVPVRILVLEDSSLDATLTENEVKKAGLPYTLRIVATRAEYVTALRDFTPDLIISDHNLPQFGGRAALELARDLVPDVPLILVTGSLDEETAVQYMKAGAADYIIKDRLTRLGPAVLGALEQSRQRRALRAYDQLLREIIDANPNLVFVKDWDGRFVLANRALAEIYGATVEALVGKTDADFNPNREEVERFLLDDREVMASGRPKVIPEEPVTNPATGKTRWFYTVKVALRLPGDDRPKVLGVATDVTERRLLEEQLRQAQKMEAVGQLAGGVAHDFNNILTAILGYTDLLAEDLGPADPRRDDVTEIQRAAQQAAGLTRQLLAFSRRQVLEPRVLSVNDVVTGLERMARRLVGEQVALESRLDPAVGHVRADPGQLEQVLMNLVVNARDAMPQGGRIVIETANVQLDDTYAREHPTVVPGRYVQLAVSDTGTGMDAATKARIFEPFFTTKGPGRGTGLGLSTVYGIVKQSGGNIWVYSEPGRGTTLKIYLPRVDDPLDAPKSPSALPSLRGTETVLLVEDAEGIRTLTRRVLEGCGYTVIAAQSGAEALDLARAHAGPIHVVLTDVVIPDMNGPDLVARLAPERPGIRILYMSGYTEDMITHQGVLAQDVAYLQKPFTTEALARRVREVLDGP